MTIFRDATTDTGPVLSTLVSIANDGLRLPDGRMVVPGNRWDLAPTDILTPDPMVSVIVPYYRDRRQLDLLLEALSLQDFPSEKYEIIVVDDGSPEPLSLSSPNRNGTRVSVLRQADEGFRAAAARNLGVSQATGEVLCFLDQDTLPEPEYLRRLIRLPSVLPDALVVGRRRHADLTGWTPDRIQAWLTGNSPAPPEFTPPAWLADAYRSSRDLLHVDDTSYRFVISAVMCCSAMLYREIGGFDESFTRYGGEDWDLAFRAYNAGAVLAHEPSAVAWHDGPDWAGRGDEAGREQEKGEERLALARRIPDLVRIGPPVDGEPGPADLIIRWTNTTAVDTTRLTTAVEALLATAEHHSRQAVVFLDPGQRDRLPAQLTRTIDAPAPPDVLARALDLIELDGDCRPSPSDLERVSRSLRSRTTDRVRLVRGDSPVPVMTGTTARAFRRAERWSSLAPRTDLVEALFESEVCPGAR